MNAPLSFETVAQALAATPIAALPCAIDPVELRAQLIARHALRPHVERRHDFAIGVALDDAAHVSAALEILQHVVRGSAIRLERVLEQCDPRVAAALRALVVKRGLQREAA